MDAEEEEEEEEEEEKTKTNLCRMRFECWVERLSDFKKRFGVLESTVKKNRDSADIAMKTVLTAVKRKPEKKELTANFIKQLKKVGEDLVKAQTKSTAMMKTTSVANVSAKKAIAKTRNTMLKVSCLKVYVSLIDVLTPHPNILLCSRLRRKCVQRWWER